MRTLLAGLVAALLALPAAAQAPGAPVPEWHLEYLAYLSRDSGRWIADNAAYRSDAERVTEYVQEFGLSFDGESMIGRFYGLEDGRRDITRWEYRAYWDAGTATSVMLQIGWGGGSGTGTIAPEGDAAFRYRQTVSTPGLPSRIEEQLITIVDENTFRMDAWGVDAGGARVPTRSYTYAREPVFR